MIFQLLALAFSLVAISAIGYSLIANWIQASKTQNSSYALVIKQRLSSGKYKIVTGIFDVQSELETAKVWETENIDTDLSNQFGTENEFVISL